MIPQSPPPLAEIAHGVLAAAWRRRYAILLPLVLLPPVAGVMGSFAPRAYETRMSVLVQEPGRFNPFLEDLSVRSNLRDRMEGLRALLTSRHVLLPVAQDLGMVEAGASEGEQSRAVGSLATRVSVQLIGQEMVELRYRAARPEGMDRVLSRIGQRFIERVRGPEDSSLRDSVSFLEHQLKQSQAGLEEAENAVAAYKSAHAAQLPELRNANIQRLATLREHLAEREVTLAGAEREIASVSERLLTTDPVLGRIEQDMVAATVELSALRARYTDAHSKVQAALARLEGLEQERAGLMARANRAATFDRATLWNFAALAAVRPDGGQPLLVSQVAALEAGRARVELLRGETANIRASVAALEADVAGSGEVERDLRRLEREVAVKAELTQALRTRYERARVTADLATQQAPERIKVIDRPYEPTAPVKPMTLIFALAGIFGGLAIGIGLAILMELLDGTLRRIRETEKLLGVPVLARFPRLA
jgi:polysaccharide chain length determinant protein (PEP-CTERM system associated)